MNQLSTSGFLMSWGRGIALFLLWENAVLATWKGPINLAIKCLKLSKKPLSLTKRVAIPSAPMPLLRRWKTFALPSRSYLKGSLHQLATRRYPATWFLTSKWRCKARLVAGGHKTKAPATIKYVGVVPCETIHIALLMVVLNDLKDNIGDVFNTYHCSHYQEGVDSSWTWIWHWCQ